METGNETQFLEKIRRFYFEDIKKVTDSASVQDYLNEIRMIIDRRLSFLKNKK